MSASFLKFSNRNLLSFLRKLVFGTLALLGVGYISTSVATLILLYYFLSLYEISSVPVVIQMSGLLLFAFAEILLIVVGVSLVMGAIQFFGGYFPKKVMIFGVFSGSLYLLCLGIGSALLTSWMNVNVILLIVSAVLFMAGTAIYVLRLFRFRFVGSILGIIGAILLAFSITRLEIFGLVFVDWGVPFPGPFMSLAFIEGFTMILGSFAAFLHSLLSEHQTKAISYILLPVAALVYGIGLFTGSFVLSFSLLDRIWKAPWVGPLQNRPSWVLSTVTFWSASLVMLEIAGILLILSSYVAFFFAVSDLEE